MSLVRGNRRSTSNRNSYIDPGEECKYEYQIRNYLQDVFKNNNGQYIEPVLEEKEENIKETNNYSEGSYISLDDLGGDKQITTENDDEEDE